MFMSTTGDLFECRTVRSIIASVRREMRLRSREMAWTLEPIAVGTKSIAGKDCDDVVVQC